ncbi:MAG: hypothetical protein AMXMBFR8_12010 [Nevskiales bacterium]
MTAENDKNITGRTGQPTPPNNWFGELSLCNFINSFYQYRDLRNIPGCSKVLIIGPGKGLDTAVLRWRQYDVTTLDIDDSSKPDLLGDARDLGVIANAAFDVVIASHVLEHLPVLDLDRAFSEIARVGRFAIIYLPVHGVHTQIRVAPGLPKLDFSINIDFTNFLRAPSGDTPAYMDGQHYWEIGMRGFRVKDVRKRMSQFFDVLSDYRNQDWLPSHNFVLKSRRSAQS